MDEISGRILHIGNVRVAILLLYIGVLKNAMLKKIQLGDKETNEGGDALNPIQMPCEAGAHHWIEDWTRAEVVIQAAFFFVARRDF